MMNYVKTNRNPSGKSTGDCVVRAIMTATNQTWVETYKALCESGLALYRLPNDKEAYGAYLKDLGWKKQPQPKDENGRRMELREFALKNPRGTYIINVRKHVTVLVDATLIDSWNCGGYCVGNYWKK